MNSHKNARLTLEGRKLLVERIAIMGLKPAAQAAGISERTARKWLLRFELCGVEGLSDLSSRPLRTRSTIDAELAQRIEQLRRNRMPVRRIAAVVGRSVATISRVVARLGLSSLKALEPVAAVGRYERSAPGELLHIASSGCLPTMGQPTARGCLPRPVRRWVSSTPLPSHTGLKPTAKRSDSFRLACESGPMAEPGGTAMSARPGCLHS